MTDPIEVAAKATHPDDQAVDRFAIAMKAKLAKKRAEGRGGWDNKDECSNEVLSKLLIDHIQKGDPVDVGNLAMMIHQRGETITLLSSYSSPPQLVWEEEEAHPSNYIVGKDETGQQIFAVWENEGGVFYSEKGSSQGKLFHGTVDEAKAYLSIGFEVANFTPKSISHEQYERDLYNALTGSDDYYNQMKSQMPRAKP